MYLPSINIHPVNVIIESGAFELDGYDDFNEEEFIFINMAKDSNIVHQYFKKEIEGAKILVKVNPIHFTGIELIIDESGELQSRDMEFDAQIFDDLKHDGFIEVNALEFNIYLSGLL